MAYNLLVLLQERLKSEQKMPVSQREDKRRAKRRQAALDQVTANKKISATCASRLPKLLRRARDLYAGVRQSLANRLHYEQAVQHLQLVYQYV